MDRRVFLAGLGTSVAAVVTENSIQDAAERMVEVPESVVTTSRDLLAAWYDEGHHDGEENRLQWILNRMAKEQWKNLPDDRRIGDREVRRQVSDGTRPVRVVTPRFTLDLYEPRGDCVPNKAQSFQVPFATTPCNMYLRGGDVPYRLGGGAENAIKDILAEAQRLPGRLSRPQAVVQVKGYLLDFFFFTHVVPII